MVVEEGRLKPNSFTELSEARLAGEPRRSQVVIKLINRRIGLSIDTPDSYESPVDLPEQGEVKLAPNRHHSISAHDSLQLAKNRLARGSTIGTLPEKEKIVQVDALCVHVEDGVLPYGQLGFWRRSAGSGDNRYVLRRSVNDLHVSAGAPRCVAGADGIHVPAQTPIFVRSVMSNEGRSRAEAVVRRNAAHCDVQRMIGKERLSATEDAFEAVSASQAQALVLAAKVSAQLALLSYN